MKFYICELVDGSLELTEHLASKWVEPKNIVEDEFMQADKVILIKLKNDKEFK